MNDYNMTEKNSKEFIERTTSSNIYLHLKTVEGVTSFILIAILKSE